MGLPAALHHSRVVGPELYPREPMTDTAEAANDALRRPKTREPELFQLLEEELGGDGRTDLLPIRRGVGNFVFGVLAAFALPLPSALCGPAPFGLAFRSCGRSQPVLVCAAMLAALLAALWVSECVNSAQIGSAGKIRAWKVPRGVRVPVIRKGYAKELYHVGYTNHEILFNGGALYLEYPI